MRTRKKRSINERRNLRFDEMWAKINRGNQNYLNIFGRVRDIYNLQPSDDALEIVDENMRLIEKFLSFLIRKSTFQFSARGQMYQSIVNFVWKLFVKLGVFLVITTGIQDVFEVCVKKSRKLIELIDLNIIEQTFQCGKRQASVPVSALEVTDTLSLTSLQVKRKVQIAHS